MSPESESLLDDYFNGKPVSSDELQALLRDDAGARKVLRELAAVDVMLRLEAESANRSSETKPTSQGDCRPFRAVTRPPRGEIFAWAVASIALSALLAFVWLQRAGNTHTITSSVATPDQNGATVATVLMAQGVHSESGDLPSVGDRLRRGRLSFQAGTVSLQFDNGSLITLIGPAIFDILGSQSAVIELGQLLFDNSQSGEFFDLGTPHSKLLDIGTRYGVRIDRQGEEILVLDGEVWRSARANPDESCLVRAGNVHRLGSGIELLNQGDHNHLHALSMSLSSMNTDPRNTYVTADHFDYPDGVYPKGDHLRGGLHWTKPWEWISRDLSEKPIGVSRIALRQGRLIAGTNTIIQRSLDQQLDTSRDEISYFCVEFEFIEPCDLDVFFVRLFDEHGAAKNCNLTMELVICGHQNLILCHLGETRSSKAYSFARPGPYRVLGKVITSQAGLDQVYVNLLAPGESLPQSPPEDWLLSSRPTDLNLPFNRIALQTYTKSSQAIDRVCLSNSWHDLCRVCEQSTRPLPLH